MPVKVDLGSLCIRANNTDLKLDLRSSISCTASGEDEAKKLEEQLTSSELNDHTFGCPFLYSHGSVKLMIMLRNDVALISDARAAISDTFSAQLRCAMVLFLNHCVMDSTNFELRYGSN